MPKTRKAFLLIYITSLSLLFCPALFAQNNLNKEIILADIKQQPIGKVLDKISNNGSFSFAYNNKTVPADSLVSLPAYRGSLFSLLDRLLGSNYEFKEVAGYVVLRHAPNRLFITAEVNMLGPNEGIIKGYVSDDRNHTRIDHASVYEKNLLVSAITDKQGYFELKLKGFTGAVVLTVSKESYRDTSLFMLNEVHVYSRTDEKKYQYYPEEAGKSVESNRFARFFISSKQLMQGINLGNYFAASPYQISLTPGLSSHGMFNSQVIDHFSLNLLGGYTAGINGFEFAGLFNINRKNMRYFQAAGIFNMVGGQVSGFQAAGIFNNVLQSTSGVQLGGFANINGEANGLQVAGLVNQTKGLNTGLQLSGLLNVAAETKGLQLAGLANWSSGQTGWQFASIANVAKKVKGLQIATLVNIADSSDYPIGLVNFIRNGEKSLAVSTDESLFTHVDFRSGGRVLYGVIGLGFKFDAQPTYAANFGLGIHIIPRQRFSLDGEYFSQLVFNDRKMLYQVGGLRLLPGYKFTRCLRVFAGPSLQGIYADQASDATVNGWVLSRHSNGSGSTVFDIGFTGGLQYLW
ncbi:carboxypeptidase-like regulatory domain-containing protein [Mucilaginibacter dorajii]|uniref:Carboxypeptidase-like regulatory domain-containing protein n=1 Tax=Mucilaginibacter dorajii TaxID=692994 RepID=A0ABP7PKR7_9SPHI|nr:carboxypeptidase-like regulatory domain-containing protein [Mucilaginibacter dorajii]MCS3733606.1 hypothetical protein [Mucilaginibacter dorajii]